MTKSDLLKNALTYLVNEQCILNLTDNAPGFQLYKFTDNGTIEPYLFSLVYPRSLYSVTDDDDFKNNFHIVNTLMNAIIIDAFVKEINNSAAAYIKKIDKTNKLNETGEKWSWNWDWNNLSQKKDSEIFEELKTVLNIQTPITFEQIYNIYTPNILAYAFFYCIMHKRKDLKNKDDKRPSTFMEQQIFYSGGKRSDSVNWLSATYPVFSKNFNSFFDASCESNASNPTDSDTTTPNYLKKLLSLYEFNKKTHVFDINLMNSFPEYKSYTIDGLFTKLVLGKTIEYNRNKLLSVYADKQPQSSDDPNLGITAIENSPDNILSNLEQIDLDFINFMINRTAATLKRYYKFTPEKTLLDLISNIERYIAKFEINLNCLSDYVDKTDLLYLPPHIDITTQKVNEILEYMNFTDMLSSVEAAKKNAEK